MAAPERLQFGEFELDCMTRLLTRNRRPVPLGSKAFDLLVYLARNSQRVVEKNELIAELWPDSFVGESNLAQQISLLRKALSANHAAEHLILTIPGRGYQFAASVERVGEPSRPDALLAGSPLTRRSSSNLYETNAGALLLHKVDSIAHLTVEELTEDEPTRLARRIRRRKIALITGATLAVAAVTAAVIYRVTHPVHVPTRLIVAADLLNQTSDPSFDDGLQTALRVDLEQSPFIELLPRSKLRETLLLMQKPESTPIGNDIAREICQRQNYEAMLSGTLERIGSSYMLAMEASDCVTGEVFAAEKASSTSKDGILTALDDVTRKLRRDIGESRRSVKAFQVPLSLAMTPSLEALKQYSLGSQVSDAGRFQESVSFFQRALELDPDFAVAEQGLGIAHYNMGSSQQAAAELAKAYAMSSSLDELHKLRLKTSYDEMSLGDLDAGAADLRLTATEFPDYYTSWINLTMTDMLRGRIDEAVAAGEHEMKYDPEPTAVAYEDATRAYLRAARFAEAKRTIQRAQAAGKDSIRLHTMTMNMAMCEGDQGTIDRESEWLSHQDTTWAFLEYKAFAAADEGRAREMESLFPQSVDEALKEGLPEDAESIREDEVYLELQLGRPREAAALIRHFVKPDPLSLATFQGLMGDAETAQKSLRAAGPLTQATHRRYLDGPFAQAAVARAAGRDRDALSILEVSRPYELAGPYVILLRGELYLRLKDGAHAGLEFQNLIDHPALEDPMSPGVALAHLGLARADMLQGKREQARSEYQAFLERWKNADPDLPDLIAARLEYAQL